MCYVFFRWLNSSQSLQEQGIRDNDFLLLKYKFFVFYDLNPKVSDVYVIFYKFLIAEQNLWVPV